MSYVQSPMVGSKNRMLVATVSLLLISALQLSHLPAFPPSAQALSTPTRSGQQQQIKEQALGAYLDMPLLFIANQGQKDGQVAYYSQGSEGAIYFTAQEVVMVLPSSRHSLDDTVLRARFVGADPTWPSGEARKSSRVNYLIGNDPQRWQTGIATYGEVIYRDLYPGIDLHYTGRKGALKYTFVVQPGADPSQIRLGYQGVDKLRLDRAGHLFLQAGGREIQDTRPYAYQEIPGRKSQRVPVETAFAVHGQQTYGFEIQGEYDPRYPLVIDPTLLYASYFGGSDEDRAFDIAVDKAGNAYITGRTLSTDLPTQTPYQADTASGYDILIAKIDASQSGDASLVYATYLGGSRTDQGLGIAVDKTDTDAVNAYVTGSTTSLDFPTTANAYQPGPYDGDYPVSGNERAFVTKLSADGSTLRYSTHLRYTTEGEIIGMRWAKGRAIAVNDAGVAFVTGDTISPDFPTTANAYQKARAGDGSTWDAFFTKLDTTQSGDASLVYSTYLGGEETERGMGIAVDSNNQAYLTGLTLSPDFPTQMAYQDSHSGEWDAFVAKFSADGAALSYATYLGGSDADHGYRLAVDDTGNAYVTGATQSTDFPTRTPYQANNQGGYDAFMVKLDTTQNGDASLVTATYLGGEGDECAYSGCDIAVDEAGHAYVAGSTSSSYFPIHHHYEDDGLWADGFVTQFDATGTALVYSTYVGAGDGSDGVSGIDLDDEGQVYVGGMTTSKRFFDPTQNAYQTKNAGEADAFIIVLGEDRVDLSTSSKRVSPAVIEPGTMTMLLGTLHYTLTLANTGSLTATTALLTDTLPSNLTHISGPVCSSGTCRYHSDEHRITWAGSVEAQATVLITYTGQVSASTGTGMTMVIINTAEVNDGVNPPFTLTARAMLNPHAIYLPLVVRQ